MEPSGCSCFGLEVVNGSDDSKQASWDSPSSWAGEWQRHTLNLCVHLWSGIVLDLPHSEGKAWWRTSRGACPSLSSSLLTPVLSHWDVVKAVRAVPARGVVCLGGVPQAHESEAERCPSSAHFLHRLWSVPKDCTPNTGKKGRSAKNRTQKAPRIVTFVSVHYEYLCYIHSDMQLIVFLSKLSLFFTSR